MESGCQEVDFNYRVDFAEVPYSKSFICSTKINFWAHTSDYTVVFQPFLDKYK